MPSSLRGERLDEPSLFELGQASVEGPRTEFDASEVFDVLDEGVTVLRATGQASEHENTAI
jgi:hypothetical protein